MESRSDPAAEASWKAASEHPAPPVSRSRRYPDVHSGGTHVALFRKTHGGISPGRLRKCTVDPACWFRLAVIGAVTIIAGCVRVYPPDIDVRVRGVVERSGVLGIVGDTRLPYWADRFVVLELSSRSDFVGRADSKGALCILTAYFCDSDTDVPTLADSQLYVNGRLAMMKYDGIPNLPEANDEGVYVVDGLLHVSDPRTFMEHDPFDLEKDQRDVCVYVVGGIKAMPLSGFKSNLVRIPKEEITAALDGE